MLSRTLESISNSFLSAASGVLDHSPNDYSLPPDLPLETLVPLAALLLDYPVAYVPAQSQGSTGLTHVRLDLYHVHLVYLESAEQSSDLKTRKHSAAAVSSLPTRHVVLQFSCPVEARGDPLSDSLKDSSKSDGRCAPETLIRQLKDTFNTRLARAGLSSSWMIEIIHDVVERDGIAL